MYIPAPITRITLLGLCLCLLRLPLAAAPQAAFSANQTIGCVPLTVHFTNQSTGSVSYAWDLGNGNTSTLTHPVNVYTTPGAYTVSLVATDGAGLSDTAVHAGFITVVVLPSVDFSAATQSACVDSNLITFTNLSPTGMTCLWDFGDGTVSSQYSPSHSYQTAGTYTVSLMVTNAYGCVETRTKAGYIVIRPRPVATATVNQSLGCDSTVSFQFSGSSPTAVSWQWNFGDGTTANGPSATHRYATSGQYAATLSVTDGYGCSGTADSVLHMNVLSPDWLYFIFDSRTGCAPFVCRFYQNDNGVSTLWDFGDGTTSTNNSPSHTYRAAGTYSVSLTVTGTNGCTATYSRPNLIEVGDAPMVDFSVPAVFGCSPFTAGFTNLSSNYSTCRWNFGDGTTSTQVNPSHTYSNNGTYNVSLTCTNAFGCSTTVAKNSLLSVTTPAAIFGAAPRSGCPPLAVSFSNTSLGNGLSYAWDFGDGSVSTQAVPAHAYAQAGNYNVTLTVTDSSGCSSTLSKQAYIQVSDPAAGYVTPPVTAGCAPYTTRFTDGTAGAVSWLWDFGDGTTSTLQNPEHTYTTPGLYTVSLTTQTAGGSCAAYIPNFSTYDIQGGYAAFTDSFDQCPPYDVYFFDSSASAVSWYWQFGDGTTSTLQNPTHTYALPGYHSVSLVVTTSAGCTYSTMKSNGIYFAPFGANFYSVPMGNTFPMTVNFYANSINASGWLWDFGDSTSSTLENPSHTYTDSGNYNVTLTISNGLCSLFYDPPPLVFSPPDSGSMAPPATGAPPVPQFGCTPFNVSFAYAIRDAVSWQWYFGDGDSSSAQYPIHTYHRTGVYSVDLVTTDSFGIASSFRFDSIVHVNGPQAAFTFAQSPNCQYTQINLDNQSAGAQHYSWDFGDGATDTLLSPVHLYTSGLPNYIITLTASDDYGCQSTLSTSLFANTATPVLISERDVCGADTVHFSSGLQHYVSYVWDFGDGTTDSSEAPWHIYAAPGSYTPSLTVTDPNGCTQTFTSPYPVTVSAPVVNFSSPVVQDCDHLTTTFSNQSAFADSYLWDFGDSTTSTYFQPTHTYSRAGTYTVTLTAYKNGCGDSLARTNYLRVDTAHADFSYTLNGICLPFTAAFTDLSYQAVSWSWDFGDNRTAALQSPVHVYDSINPVKGVSLYITDSNGCVGHASSPLFSGPQATLSADQTGGCLPLTVSFTGDVSHAGSYYWDFGDGTTSPSANPTHTYAAAGTYTVRLVATSLPQYSFCTDTFAFDQPIRVVEPKAGFTSPDLSACAPSLVHFTNSSVDGDTYTWDFGDGSTSSSVSPTHLYKNPGVYSVSLVASSAYGCSDTLLRNQYIRVLGPVTRFSLSDTTGCLPLAVSFRDSSVDAVSWMWNFGDGSVDASQFPVHTYSDSGIYSVTLITTDTGGCTSFQQYPFRVHANPNPVAAWSSSDSSGCGSLTTYFTNRSSGFSSIWWDFGDGSFAITANPSHTYSSVGQYDITLTAYNRYGCTDTVFSPLAMRVQLPPVAAFTTSATQGCSPLTAFFTNLSHDTAGASYTWNLGNGVVSSAPSPVGTYVDPGLYSVSLTVTNANGCSDSTAMASLIHVLDTLPPPVSEILSVSVASDNSVDITWANNPATDLDRYVLYRLNENTGGYEVIYTDTNPANTSFALTSKHTDTGLQTLRHSYTYKLQTLDLCGNTIGLDQLRAHTTINVEARTEGFSVRVDWNAYGGCPVDHYDIYRASGSGAFQRIGSVPGDSLSWIDSAFTCPELYTYRIAGVSLCQQPYDSWSDTSAARPVNVYADQQVDVVRSTVVDNAYILTEWLPPAVRPQSVVRYDVYRSSDNVHFDYLTTVSPQQTDYEDHDVDVQLNTYQYRIQVANTCDITEALSEPTTTIQLKGDKTEDRMVHLRWTPYNKWPEGVDHYLIEKQDENGQWNLLLQVPGTSHTAEVRDE